MYNLGLLYNNGPLSIPAACVHNWDKKNTKNNNGTMTQTQRRCHSCKYTGWLSYSDNRTKRLNRQLQQSNEFKPNTSANSVISTTNYTACVRSSFSCNACSKNEIKNTDERTRYICFSSLIHCVAAVIFCANMRRSVYPIDLWEK